MDWPFFETAKDADDVASALQVFVDEVEQDAVQITGDISELFAISSWLRSFDEALRNPRLARQSSRVARDLDLVIPSIETTLDLVRELLGETRLPGSAGLPDYDAVWDQICVEFERDGPPLSARLELYHRHLEAAFDLLQGRPPVEDITRLRSRVGRLLRIHESLDERMDRLTLDAQGMSDRVCNPINSWDPVFDFSRAHLVYQQTITPHQSLVLRSVHAQVHLTSTTGTTLPCLMPPNSHTLSHQLSHLLPRIHFHHLKHTRQDTLPPLQTSLHTGPRASMMVATLVHHSVQAANLRDA